jgi:hypothetical protein
MPASLLVLLEQLIAPIVVKIAMGILDRWETDPEFRAKTLPAREKLRNASNATEARDASLEIHRLLSG